MKFKCFGINTILKYQLIILVGIFVAMECFLFYHLINALLLPKETLLVKTQINSQGALNRRKIDGQIVAEGQENLYPVAINIDNHFEAWPNYGLSKASLVYETLVEGGTTRFLAIYTPSEQETKQIIKIGPVRSTRPYFVELAKEIEALLAHAGGSPAGLKKIEELQVNNLEEIAWWGPEYFWRVYSRQAPHNLFTSSKHLKQAVSDWELNNKTPSYRQWQFSPNIPAKNLKQTKNVKIRFSPADIYNVNYVYSTSSQNYLRFQAEDKHIDALNNRQIAVDNLIVQFIEKEKILDETGRLELKLVGQGKALIFRDGIEIPANWSKPDYESRTIFFDNKNNEIKLKPGNIWIEIVPGHRQLEIK